MGGQVRQLPGERVVVPGDGVCRHQILPVGAKGPAVLQEVGKAGVPFGVVGSPGVHDPQAEAPDLVGKETLKVQDPGLAPVALQQHRPAQGVHRVADHAEQALEPGLPGQAAVVGGQGAVGLVLGHAHIPGLHRRVRYEPGGAEEEHVAVKDVLCVHYPDRRQGVGLPGDTDLVEFKFPPLGHVGPHVAETQRGHHIAPHKPQPCGQGAAHIPQGQEIYPISFPGRQHGGEGVLQQLLPPGVSGVHRPNPACFGGGTELRRDAGHVLPAMEGGYVLLGGKETAVGHGEGLPSRQGLPAEEPEDLPCLRQVRQGIIGQRHFAGQGMVFVGVVEHSGTSQGSGEGCQPPMTMRTLASSRRSISISFST